MGRNYPVQRGDRCLIIFMTTNLSAGIGHLRPSYIKESDKGGEYLSPEWIRKAADGDEEAFRQLVERYQGYLMATILPIVRTPVEAQDVLQETFCQVHRSLSGYRGGNLKFWLARIATRKAIDWCRKRERLGKEVLHCSPGELHAGSTLSAEEEYLGATERGRLISSLQSLPSPYRATMAGYLLEGKSYRQLADEAGVSVKAVESRLYRARRILKNRYEEGL